MKNTLKKRSDVMIPLSVPHISGKEWTYIKECLDTEWVSSAGKFVDLFENKISEVTKSDYSIACINGTSALFISLKLINIHSDDEIIVPTVTFIAPVNAVRYHGASPIFMDCDNHFNIHAEKTIDFILKETQYQNGITINKKTKKKISAIIPVHVYGNAVDLVELAELCKKRNIKIIEDATESLGTYYKENRLDGCHTGTIGEIGCLSFNGNKIITSGGGGMILTNNSKYAEKARYLTTQAKDDPIHYIHHEIGYNFRLSNIQAALGVAQLEQLPKFISQKKKNYNHYKGEIKKIPGLSLAGTPPYADNNHWMYALCIDSKEYGMHRDELMNHLASQNIQTRPIWYLNHLQKPYREYMAYRIETAPKMLERTLNLPCSVDLTKKSINKIIEVLKNA